MTSYQEISIITDNAYKLASLINGGYYDNILYFEFHEEVDPTTIYNCLEGLNAFRERSEKFYENFISYIYVDELPAIIHVAVKIANEWFIARDCGANFYTGYGPMGILELRKACANNKIAAFVFHEEFNQWIIKKFGVSGKSKKDDKKNTYGASNPRISFVFLWFY